MTVRVILPGVTQAAAVTWLQARNLRGMVTPGVRVVTATTDVAGVEVVLFGPNIWREIRAALQTALVNNSIPAAVVQVSNGGRNKFFATTHEGAPIEDAFLFQSNGTVLPL